MRIDIYIQKGKEEVWKAFKEKARRDGTSVSKLLNEYVANEIRLDKDSQTRITSFARNGKITLENKESSIRNSFLKIPGVSFKKILQTLIAEGVEPKERASMGKRIASWLKEKGIEVVY